MKQINTTATPGGGEGKVAYLELLRIVASFLVIVNHTADWNLVYVQIGSKAWMLVIAYFFLSKIAVPVFLMISGVLLLRRVDSYRKCYTRVLRIVLCLVLFSAIYYVRDYYYWGNVEGSLIGFLKQIYHYNITNAYWYLYLYLGILLMLPLLQRLNANMGKRECRYLIVLSVLFLGTMPIVDHYAGELTYNGYFSASFFSTYIGIMFLGYYLENYTELKWQWALISVGVLAACIVFLVIATYYEAVKNPEWYRFFDERTYIPIVLASASFFYLVRWLGSVIKSEALWRGVAALGKCSFGVYLLADLFIGVYMKFYYSFIYSKNIFLVLIAYELLIFFTSLVVAAVLKQIPGIRKLV